MKRNSILYSILFCAALILFAPLISEAQIGVNTAAAGQDGITSGLVSKPFSDTGQLQVFHFIVPVTVTTATDTIPIRIDDAASVSIQFASGNASLEPNFTCSFTGAMAGSATAQVLFKLGLSETADTYVAAATPVAGKALADTATTSVPSGRDYYSYPLTKPGELVNPGGAWVVGDYGIYEIHPANANFMKVRLHKNAVNTQIIVTVRRK